MRKNKRKYKVEIELAEDFEIRLGIAIGIIVTVILTCGVLVNGWR